MLVPSFEASLSIKPSQTYGFGDLKHFEVQHSGDMLGPLSQGHCQLLWSGAGLYPLQALGLNTEPHLRLFLMGGWS